jgi:phage baseplate assembly protein W
MANNFNKEWIGQGISMPNPFNANKGTVSSNTGVDRIRQSIYYILSTIPGERLLMPQFGSKLGSLIFDPNDDTFADLAKIYVEEALSKWEPRITVTNVEVLSKSDSNTVPISIKYRINSTNMNDNYVYPFQSTAYQLGGE